MDVKCDVGNIESVNLESNKNQLVESNSVPCEDILSQEPIVDYGLIPVWVSKNEEKIFEGVMGQDGNKTNIPIQILDDTGCMGMIISKNMVELHGLKTYETLNSTKVMFANPNLTVESNLLCDVWVKIGKWKKRITFSVLEINYDLIFGLPFHNSIKIVHEEWSQKIKMFRTSTGKLHRWYGLGH